MLRQYYRLGGTQQLGGKADAICVVVPLVIKNDASVSLLQSFLARGRTAPTWRKRPRPRTRRQRIRRQIESGTIARPPTTYATITPLGAPSAHSGKIHYLLHETAHAQRTRRRRRRRRRLRRATFRRVPYRGGTRLWAAE